ncbi:MAG: hypothetical protein LBC40_08735 [Dysgonamonadaceae bacterium]|jgi:hypothetical protein|nr:hypothetical protein [Dysgonamonadaceae bacterium]
MIRKIFVNAFYSILLLGGIIAGFACNDDERYPAKGIPEVLYTTTPMKIDLNIVNNPPLIAVVQSETGLKSVRMYLLKTGDSETPWENEITYFFNKNSYSINLNVVYTEDMTGFKIVAVDLAGQTTVSILPFDITPLRNPPAVTFNEGIDELEYREGSAMPEITIKVLSEENLQYLVLSEVVNRVETKINIYGNDTLRFTGGEQSFTINMADDAYRFKPGTTALKATAAAGPAGNPKIKVGTLYVNYVVIPPPVVTFDNTAETVTVDEFQALTLTGHITAESKLSSVKYYRQTASGLTPIGSELSFDPAVDSYDFTAVLDRATVDVTAIVVEATDATGKQTRTAKTVSVNELFQPPVIHLDREDNFFNGLSKNDNIAVTGTITSSAGLASVAFVTILKDGTETSVQETVTEADKMNFPLNQSLTAVGNLAGIRIEVKDVNGKEIVKSIDVHVGYYYYHILASMDGSPNHADSQPGCFLSAADGRVYDYCEAMNNVDKIDMNFSSYTSNTVVCISGLVSDTKFKHATCGLDKWTGIRKLKIRTANSIKRSTFDRCTIDDILAQTAPSGDNRINFTEGNFETPTEDVAIYITQIDGTDKRVVVCYDKFELRTPNIAASQFWVKMKVEK